ncbi:MAG TPA: DinB family protein, partial [Caulobacteraceae bacterium]|nr:DinB family protein [Caulobacteraceae bacterium]
MRRSLVPSLVVAMLAGGLAILQPAAAQPNMKHPINDSAHAAVAPAAGEAPAPGSLRAMTLRQIGAAEQKLVALAEAMPADKYGWRPGEGVRSVGEVFMHVASANFWLPTFWGAKVPAGVDPRNLEKEGADKAKTVAALKQSFDFVHQAINALPDSDLQRPIKIFGRDALVAEAMMGIASHDHEHLGQAIAYARMNGIV